MIIYTKVDQVISMSRFLIAFVTFIVTLAVAVPLVLLSFNWYEQLLVEFLWWHITILFIAGSSALLFWAYRDKIFQKIGLTTKNSIDDVADSFFEMINKFVSGDHAEASSQSKLFIQRILSRYAAIKSMTWIVGTVFAFLAIFATMAASAILIKQNSIIMSQNTLIESQNKYFQDQNQKIQLQIDNQLQEEKTAHRNKLIEILYENTAPESNSSIVEFFGGSNKQVIKRNTSVLSSWAIEGKQTSSDPGKTALWKKLRANNEYVVKRPKYNLRSRNNAFQEYINAEIQAGREEVDLKHSLLDGLDSSDWKFKKIRIDLSHAQIIASDFSYRDLTNFTFKNSIINDSSFYESTLSDVDLEGVNLEGSNLTYSNFAYTNIENGNLRNTSIEGACFFNSNLMHLDLSNAVNLAFIDGQALNFARAGYTTDFSNSNMKFANISDSFMPHVIFYQCDLKEANLSNSDFRYSRFIDADLALVNFKGADLPYVDFLGSDLSGANFDKASLENTNFANAYLVGASFKHTYFNKVNFNNAKVGSRNWFDDVAIHSDSILKLKKYWQIIEDKDKYGREIFVIKQNRTVAVKPTESYEVIYSLPELLHLFEQTKKIRGIDRMIKNRYATAYDPLPNPPGVVPPPPR